MQNKQALRDALANQTALLRGRGHRARLPNSKDTLEAAVRLFREHNSQDNQDLWRIAAIHRSAVAAFEGDWKESFIASHPDPQGKRGGPETWPLVHSTGLWLQALMFTNHVVAGVHLGLQLPQGPHNIASSTAWCFEQIRRNNLNRWHAVVIVAKAYYERTMDLNSYESAMAARTLINPIRQPELNILALHLAGMSKGVYKASKFSRAHQAGFNPLECMYYCNED